MDTTTLVACDPQEGQRAVDQLVGGGIPVRAACLLKRQDRIKPSLYIATPLVDQKGPIQAYHDVLTPLTSLDGMLDALDISLVGESHPLVRDVQSILRHGVGRLVLREVGTFGGLAVEWIYVYPPSEAFPGFNQFKQRFPSTEVFTINLPNGPALPQNWECHPTVISLISKVNAYEFEGKPPETLYFVGPRYSREDKVKQLTFALRPEGWNTMYDPKTNQWQRVVFEKVNRPLFEPADFTPLLELKSPPVAASV